MSINKQNLSALQDHEYVDSTGFDDQIVLNNSTNTTLTTATGNDTVQIDTGNTNIVVQTGADKDVIYNEGKNSTINAGKGNDVASLSSNSRNSLILYANGDGNDTIYGFSSTDSLKITSGTISNAIAQNDDLVLKIGSGSILLKMPQFLQLM